jgi:hypothetical protein
MHGATLLVTAPHEIAPSEIGARIMHINKTTHATFMLAINKMCFCFGFGFEYFFFLGLIVWCGMCYGVRGFI